MIQREAAKSVQHGRIIACLVASKVKTVTKNIPRFFLSTGSFFQTLGKFNHQTFKKGLIQTNAFSKSLTKNAAQASRKRKLEQRNHIFSKGFCEAKKFVYNVAGKPEWESAIEVYSDLVLNAVGIDDTIVTYEDAEPFTTNIKTIECSKAVKDLKHDPKVTLEEGIRRTVEWMKRYYRTG